MLGDLMDKLLVLQRRLLTISRQQLRWLPERARRSATVAPRTRGRRAWTSPISRPCCRRSTASTPRFARFFVPHGGPGLGRTLPDGPRAADRAQERENIAEEVGAPPRKLQEFLSDSPWDDEGCIGELQRFVGEQLGAPWRRARPRRHRLPQEGGPLGRRGPAVLGHPGAGRQLPGRGVPGLRQRPRPHPRRPAAVPHRELARRSGEADLAAGRGAGGRRLPDQARTRGRDADARPPSGATCRTRG